MPPSSLAKSKAGSAGSSSSSKSGSGGSGSKLSTADKAKVTEIQQLGDSVLASKKNLNDLVAIQGYIERGATDAKQHVGEAESDASKKAPKRLATEVVFAALKALGRIYAAAWQNGDLLPSKSKSANGDNGGSVKKSGEDDAAVIVANWTRERYLEFIRHLLVLLSSHPDAVVQVASLDVAMQMVQRESVAMSKSGNNGESEDGKFRYIFAHTLFCDVIDAVLAKPAVDEHATVNALLMRYINMYDDLRFYALKAIARHFSIQQNAAAVTTATTNGSTVKDTPKKRKNASDGDSDASDNKTPEVSNSTRRSLQILTGLAGLRSSGSQFTEWWAANPRDDARSAIPAASSKHLPILHMAPHRRAFSDAWLAVLQTKLTPEMYKQVLLLLHKRIIPHMSSPIELMDFLTDSYNAGSISNNSSSSSSSSNSNNSSVISILALNGLFTLMQEYNLNYPDFYRKLYSLFNYQLLHVKYRSRFFRLADLFLSSTHIPSQLVAAFIKRMARLTLSAPPAGTIIVLALISNLLKRHPSCMVLIHRAPTISDDTGALDAMLMEDKFDFEAKDPLESSAMESSLWEIASLQDHYLHVVATLAKSFNEPFTKPPYVLEDFLDQTYATLHDAETASGSQAAGNDNKKQRKAAKKMPALAIAPVTGLCRSGEAIDELFAF